MRERAREPVEGAPPPKYKVKEVVLSYKRENKMKKTANNFILYIYLFIIIISIILRALKEHVEEKTLLNVSTNRRKN